MYRNLYKQHSQGVVMLAKQLENTVEFLGTGFLAHEKGYILTCSHIINPTDSIVALFPPGLNTFNPMTLSQVKAIPLILVQNNPINDVSLLKITISIDVRVPINLLGETTTLECGSNIATIGFPFGYDSLHLQSITQGIVSSKTVSANGAKLIQFDSMVHEGNSGGPLLDLKTGKVIGIVTNRFNPNKGGGIMLANRQIGVETNISYASIIEYGIELIKNEIKL